MSITRNLFVLGVILFSASLSAGNESHGGDIVICTNQPPVVLDYYHAALKAFGEEKANIEDISSWSRERVILFFRNKLKNYIFRLELEQALFKFGDMDKWIEADLKEVDDSDEPYFLPKECQRVQGAVRHGNELYVDPTWVRKLTPAQEGILVVHEAIFYVANRHNVTTSVAVRELIRALLRLDSKDEQVFRAIKSLWSIVYAFEALPDHRYTSPTADPGVKFRVLSVANRTLEVRLYNSSNVAVMAEPAIITCDATGSHCVVTKASTWNDHPFGWLNATLDFEDGMRQFTIRHSAGSMKRQFYTSDLMVFPIPERRRRAD